MTTTSRDALTRLWPLFGLRLATPRLILRPICDDDLAELVDLAVAGIHPPDRMPFLVPWTDVTGNDLIENLLRYHWRTRAESVPEDWSVQFAVRSRGALLGVQEISGRNFVLTRVMASGSWLGRAHQGHGFGTEMRAAVLDFAFDHLKATRATSTAFSDNLASHAVSRQLGYVTDGSDIVQRRPGEVAIDHRLLLTPETFRKPSWSVQVAGLDACRGSFGL